MAFAKRYLDTDGSDIHWVMIRALMASVSDTVIFPLQDVLGVGSEGRMNLPGTSSGNWRWRYRAEELTLGTAGRLSQMVQTYDRQPAETNDSPSIG
jgi:4-alpha-glucanotransferase